MRDSQVDPWSLVVEGRLEEAVSAYTMLYSRDPSPDLLFNRGVLLLEMRRPDIALTDFRRLIQEEGPSTMPDGYLVFLGICHWFLDSPQEALLAWKRSLSAPYTDAGGGLEAEAVLLYAGTRLEDLDAVAEARQALRSHQSATGGSWHAAATSFLLGNTTSVDLRTALSSVAHPALRARWECQADFYDGIRALSDSSRVRFSACMKKAASNRAAILEYGHHIGRWEETRGFPVPAFQIDGS